MDRYFNTEQYSGKELDMYYALKQYCVENGKYEMINLILEYRGKPKYTLSNLEYIAYKTKYDICTMLHKWLKISQGVTKNMFDNFDKTLSKYCN
jgi:hypothetical protein